MRGFVQRNLTTIIVAMVTAAITAGGPALAAAVQEGLNADQVDGKHAVGAGSTVENRAGKLVATGGEGRLPNNIIAKAPDADELDGINGGGYRRTTMEPGDVARGLYAAWGGVGYLGDTVMFRSRLPADIAANRTTFIPQGGPYTTECPGPGEIAASDWLCVYERGRGGTTTFQNVVKPDTPTGAPGVARDGFNIYFTGTGEAGSYSYGGWVLKVAQP